MTALLAQITAATQILNPVQIYITLSCSTAENHFYLQRSSKLYAPFTRLVAYPPSAIMQSRAITLQISLEASMSFELILGAITAVTVLIYLLAVLARPERY